MYWNPAYIFGKNCMLRKKKKMLQYNLMYAAIFFLIFYVTNIGIHLVFKKKKNNNVARVKRHFLNF